MGGHSTTRKGSNMPNWVQTKLVITGDVDTLDRLARQVSQPYDTEHYNHMTNTYDKETVTGSFLLWNIIKPDDLDSYYERVKNEIEWEQRQKRTAEPSEPKQIGEIMNEVFGNLPKIDMSEISEKIAFEHQFGMGWYNWNIRNWGTKWELNGNSSVERTKPNELIYYLSSAWSPPVEALDNLAKQYPEVTMTLKAHDEGDMFACEIHWEGGCQTFDQDLPINHYLFEELYGACWVCEEGSWSEEEARVHYSCPKVGNQETANA